jgi:hypothetical protein
MKSDEKKDQEKKDPIDRIDPVDAGSTCTQKTDQGLCGRPAVALMLWPGSDPLPVCADHQNKGKVLAGSMGFVLQFDALPAKNETQGPCSCADCGSTDDWLYMHSRCHPRDATWARYDQKIHRLEILCSVCNRRIMAFRAEVW